MSKPGVSFSSLNELFSKVGGAFGGPALRGIGRLGARHVDFADVIA
jgi:hypothetical protein